MALKAETQPPKSLQFNRESALSLIRATVEQGSYLADVLANQDLSSYHFIITRRGSTDVLDWGLGESLEATKETAGEWLRRYNSRPALVA